MKATLLKIHPENPEMRKIQRVVEIIKNGGLVIYPTDTVYGLGCDIHNQKAVEKVCQIKGIPVKNNKLSFICNNLSHISEYASIETATFKVMKKALPGPFTFILKASSKVPKILNTKKKTVGIRIPENLITRTIVEELGNPIITTSIHDKDEVVEYSTDPELIYERFRDKVDMVIDGGYGNNIPSTIVDFSQKDSYEVIREGLGDIDSFV